MAPAAGDPAEERPPRADPTRRAVGLRRCQLLLACLVLQPRFASCRTIARGADSVREATVGFSLTDASGLEVGAPRARAEFQGEGPRPRRLEDLHGGHAVEHPLRLQFNAHGRDFEYHLYRNPSPLIPGAIIERATENGSVTTLAQESFVFSSPRRDAVLSFVGGGVHGAVQHGSSYFDVRADENWEGLQVVESLVSTEGPRSNATRTPERQRGDGGGAATSAAADGGAAVPRKLGVDRWTGCYKGDSQPHILSMGVVVGYKVVQRLNTYNLTVEDYMALVVAKANLLFQRQVHVVVQLHKLLIATTTSAYPELFDGASCSKSISDQHMEFSHWEKAEELALWHIFDDCFGGSGTIGLAWLGTACITQEYTRDGRPFFYNRGATWLNVKPVHPLMAWTTFAHEVGHNINAEHSFENGQGKTGGIMDYGDGTLDGYYQFNSEYRREQVCDWMNALANSCKLFKPLEPTCGNSIHEAGEACECERGAQECKNCCGCKLELGKQCSPEGVLGKSCCSDDGSFKAVGEKCEDAVGTAGYCFEGACRVEENCPWIAMSYSKRNSPNDCEYLCEDSSGRLSRVTTGGGSYVHSKFPVGTPCGSNSRGRCEDNGEGSNVCKANGQLFVSVALPTGPTVAPQPAVPNTTKHTVEGCVGFGQQAFIGYPDIFLESRKYTFEQCHQACVAEPTCESFIHSEESEACELWTPIKQQEDLIHIPQYDTYICSGKSAAAYFPDCEKFPGDRVATSLGEVPDVGCPSCEANGKACGSSTGCGGFSLAQCNEACLNNPKCHMFVHGDLSDGIVGYCELWSAAATIEKKGTIMERRRRLGEFEFELAELDGGTALATYRCPCRGEGKACPCKRSAVSKLRVPCRCTSSSANDCYAGMYCLPDGYCTETSDKAPQRRLQSCPADKFPGVTDNKSDTKTAMVDVGLRPSVCPLILLIVVAGTSWSAW